MPKDVQLSQSKLLNFLRRSRNECDANIKAIDILERDGEITSQDAERERLAAEASLEASITVYAQSLEAESGGMWRPPPGLLEARGGKRGKIKAMEERLLQQEKRERRRGSITSNESLASLSFKGDIEGSSQRSPGVNTLKPRGSKLSDQPWGSRERRGSLVSNNLSSSLSQDLLGLASADGSETADGFKDMNAVQRRSLKLAGQLYGSTSNLSKIAGLGGTFRGISGPLVGSMSGALSGAIGSNLGDDGKSGGLIEGRPSGELLQRGRFRRKSMSQFADECFVNTPLASVAAELGRWGVSEFGDGPPHDSGLLQLPGQVSTSSPPPAAAEPEPEVSTLDMRRQRINAELQPPPEEFLATIDRRKKPPALLDRFRGPSGESPANAGSLQDESGSGMVPSSKGTSRHTPGITPVLTPESGVPLTPAEAAWGALQGADRRDSEPLAPNPSNLPSLEDRHIVSNQDWRRNRDKVDHGIRVAHRWAALFGVAGMICAVAQNELVFMEWDPLGGPVNGLKLANTILTVSSLVWIYRSHHLKVLFNRVVKHLRRGTVIDVRVHPSFVLSRKRFWAEAFIVALHLPPMCTGEIRAWSLNNISVHRLETIFAVINTLRCYLLFRCVTDWYLALLPKRHTVATFSSVDLSMSFAFKSLMNGWSALPSITLAWVSMLLVTGYWFRAAENTACAFKTTLDPICKTEQATRWSLDGVKFYDKVNDLYIQNALWAMFISSLTVGYGDIYPTTIFSRSVAGLVVIGGIMCAALLTAALESVLIWTHAELSALLVIQREQARAACLVKAANILGLWWRTRQGGKNLTRGQKRQDPYQLLLDFKRTKKQGQVEVEDLSADSAKIDSVFGKAKYLEGALTALVQVSYITDYDPNDKLLPDYMQTQEARDKSVAWKKVAILLKAQGRYGVNVIDSLRRDVLGGMQEGEMDKAMAEEREKSVELAKARITEFESVQDRRLARKQANSWRWDRAEIDRRIMRANAVVAVCGMSAAVFALAQNELVFRETPIHGSLMEGLKAGSMLLCMCTCSALYYLYWLNVIFKRIDTHLKRCNPLDVGGVPVGEITGNVLFWVEFVLCGLHLPPGATFELPINNLDYVVVYRGETLFCLVNTLRIYLIARVIADSVLSKLPRRHTVSMFVGVTISKRFAFKKLLNGWTSIAYIGLFYFFILIFLAYWYRAAETTSCLLTSISTHPNCELPGARNWKLAHLDIVHEKQNDVYIYSAMWVVFITSTTVGYGDIIPTTHLSRMVAAVAGLVGIICASLITASLANEMNFTLAEQNAAALIIREQQRNETIRLAADIIIYWFRKRKGKKLSSKQANMDPYKMMIEFRRLQHAASVEVEDCAGTGDKIDHCVHRMTRVCRVMDAVGHKIWGESPAVLELVERQIYAQQRAMSTQRRNSKITGSNRLSMKGLSKIVFGLNVLQNTSQRRHPRDDGAQQGDAAQRTNQSQPASENVLAKFVKIRKEIEADEKSTPPVPLLRRVGSAPLKKGPVDDKMVDGELGRAASDGTRAALPKRHIRLADPLVEEAKAKMMIRMARVISKPKGSSLDSDHALDAKSSTTLSAQDKVDSLVRDLEIAEMKSNALDVVTSVSVKTFLAQDTANSAIKSRTTSTTQLESSVYQVKEKKTGAQISDISHLPSSGF